MFILPGLLCLVAFILVRPFEFIAPLREIPFLYIFFALAAYGYLLDLRQGRSTIRPVPHLAWAIAMTVWCLLTITIRAPSSLVTEGVKLLVAVVVYLLIAHGIQTFRAFEALALTILLCTLWISVVCVHQGMQPSECVAASPNESPQSLGRPDGRPCTTPLICYRDPPEPDADYRCERTGLFGITSIAGGRIRYIGVLQDPNEVAMTVSIAFPMAIAFYQRRRNLLRRLLLLVAFVLTTWTVVLSESRGGQLVFLSVMGSYFFRRFRWKGVVVALLLALPVLILGGRGGAEAESSSVERIENLYVGLQLFKTWPILGAGYAQFTQHHPLTAHNSYVLAAAELGVFGMVFFIMTFWLGLKIPLYVIRKIDEPEGDVARIWGMALFSSMLGLAVGIFFLSFNYHLVLWIYLGLTGALYSAVKFHQPQFRVPVRSWDILGTTTFGLLVMVGISVYVRLFGT